MGKPIFFSLPKRLPTIPCSGRSINREPCLFVEKRKWERLRQPGTQRVGGDLTRGDGLPGGAVFFFAKCGKTDRATSKARIREETEGEGSGGGGAVEGGLGWRRGDWRLICRDGQTLVPSTRLLFYFHPIKAVRLRGARWLRSPSCCATYIREAESGIEGHYLMLMASARECDAVRAPGDPFTRRPADFPSSVDSFVLYCKES